MAQHTCHPSHVHQTNSCIAAANEVLLTYHHLVGTHQDQNNPLNQAAGPSLLYHQSTAAIVNPSITCAAAMQNKNREKRVSKADMSTCLTRTMSTLGQGPLQTHVYTRVRASLDTCLILEQGSNRIRVYTRARAHPDEGQAGLEALVHACLCSPAPQQPLQH